MQSRHSPVNDVVSSLCNRLTVLLGQLATQSEPARWFAICLVASLPGLLALCVWVVPVWQEHQEQRRLLAELDLKARDGVGAAAQQSVSHVQRWQAMLRKFPLWQTEQGWLRALVDLAAGLEVTTHRLDPSGARRRDKSQIVDAVNLAPPERTSSVLLEQRGYVWHVSGRARDISRLLRQLTLGAVWIDELTIVARSSSKDSSNPHPVSASKKSRGTFPITLSAVLTFRQSGRVNSDGAPLTGPKATQAFAEAEPLPWPQPIDDRTVSNWLHRMAAPPRVSCQPSAPFKPPDPEVRRVFISQPLDAVRLAGVIERIDATGDRSLRAVFVDAQGALAVAAPNARVSAQEFLLLELNRRRAVLHSEEHGVAVLTLEPKLRPNASLGHQSIVGGGSTDALPTVVDKTLAIGS